MEARVFFQSFVKQNQIFLNKRKKQVYRCICIAYCDDFTKKTLNYNASKFKKTQFRFTKN